jgi:putative membrane protein
VAANDAELDAARLAQNQATDKDVKGFAQHMLADHSSSNLQINDLAKRLNVSPQTSSASDAFTQTAQSERSVLGSLSGAPFDGAYIDRQIADHQTVLEQIDKTLLPSASSEELKALLKRTRDVVDMHLQAAEKIQGQLTGRR